MAAKVYKDPCPCRGCNDRSALCHGTCQKYLDWTNSAETIEKNNWQSIAKERAVKLSRHKKTGKYKHE